MKIAIDISQLAYANTGVANYLGHLVAGMIAKDKENEYILFYSSLRQNLNNTFFNISELPRNITIQRFRFPPRVLDFLWNKMHIFPIEWLIGNVDIFISSDWTEPPSLHAKKITILYDLVVYKHPEESAEIIVQTQKRKLKWVKKETAKILCISEATRKDAQELLGISDNKLQVIYPGLTI